VAFKLSTDSLQNDHVPHHPRNHTLWAELRVLQACGIKVLGMFGGAAKGSYTRLDRSAVEFEAYYTPLRDFIRSRDLDGLDLDVEEPMSLQGMIRLIDRLKADFGNDFIITLAPVAPAMYDQDPQKNLSGFSYPALEFERGHSIEWYNAQFYCGWGDVRKTEGYDNIINTGWRPEKIVMGMITNPENGSGWVELSLVQETLINLRLRYPGFGGVMGWEYFNCLPGGKQRPWDWAAWMTRHVRGWSPSIAGNAVGDEGKKKQKVVAEGHPGETAAQTSDVSAKDVSDNSDGAQPTSSQGAANEAPSKEGSEQQPSDRAEG